MTLVKAIVRRNTVDGPDDIGDGRVFVIPVEESRNIRTGERDVL